jgi:hypothetical protein
MNKAKLKALLADYGRVALWTYLVIFVVVLGGFAIAIGSGIKTESSMGKAGLLGAAWVATKLTQPLRILATLALTPLVAHVLKIKKKEALPPGA